VRTARAIPARLHALRAESGLRPGGAWEIDAISLVNSSSSLGKCIGCGRRSNSHRILRCNYSGKLMRWGWSWRIGKCGPRTRAANNVPHARDAASFHSRLPLV